jgi:hypothetical protein
MVYVSQVNYKVGSYNATNNFERNIHGLISISTNKPFEGINIVDGKNLSININYVESKDYGLKVSEVDAKNLMCKVDDKGILQVSISKDSKSTNQNEEIYMQVFAPKLKYVTANAIDFLTVSAPKDSLEMEIANTRAFSFSRGVDDMNHEIKYLKLSLNNTSYTDMNTSYDRLDLSLAGHAKVTFSNDPNHTQKAKIGLLKIKTLDSSIVKFENITIDPCSGSFSDQTKVQMPAVNLNQMYRK